MQVDSTRIAAQAKLQAFPRPRSTDTLFWFFDAPSVTPGATVGPHDIYRAYLVRVVARQATQVHFHFLSFADGSDVPGGPHQVDVRDQQLVWRALPSTFESATVGGDDCAFMFLDQHTIDTRSSTGQPETAFKMAAHDSGGGTGKWPKSG